MSSSIYPCVWMNNNAGDAAGLYMHAFKEINVLSKNDYVEMLGIGNQKLMLLNGGDKFRPNPSLSLFIKIANEAAVQHAFDILAVNGKVMMPLNSYPWSSCYGWVEDQFGVSWQLMFDAQLQEAISLSPCIMFTGEKAGYAADAIRFYTSLLQPSSVDGIANYEDGEGDNTAFIKHAEFTLRNATVMAMDSSMGPGFAFDEGVSLVVSCQNQEEIDEYWHALTADGGEQGRCGWLKDRFGFSWQIVPANLGELMASAISQQNLLAALLPMKKLIIAELEKAASG